MAANAVAGSFFGSGGCCCAQEPTVFQFDADPCCPSGEADAPADEEQDRHGEQGCHCVLACGCLVKAPIATSGASVAPLLPPVASLLRPLELGAADTAHTGRLKRPPKMTVTL